VARDSGFQYHAAMRRIAVACVLLGLTAIHCEGATPTQGTDASVAGAGGAGTAGAGNAGAGGAGNGGAAGSVATDGAAGGSMCDPPCPSNLRCCGVTCIDPLNDVGNCGECGRICPGIGMYMIPDRTSFCNLGTCGAPPCSQGWCDAETLCCGTQCCSGAQICCHVPGPTGHTLQCIDPVGGRCPKE